MQVAAQLADSIVQATAVTHNPGSSPQQRGEAVQFFEQACILTACFSFSRNHIRVQRLTTALLRAAQAWGDTLYRVCSSRSDR